MKRPYKTYFCRLCGEPAESREALRRHLLSSEHNEKPGVFLDHLLSIGQDRAYTYKASYEDRMRYRWGQFARSIEDSLSGDISRYRPDYKAELARRRVRARAELARRKRR